MLHMRARRTRGSGREAGYLLLILMLAVAMITISLMSVALNYKRSIQRDREVEMIHRGVQYERAVRLYYRKNNSYPPSIDRLLETSGIRYLRKAYKDPMTPDGSWKIATLTDLAAAGGGLGLAGSTTTTGLAGATGSSGSATGANTSIFGNSGSSIFGNSSAGDQGDNAAGSQSSSTPTSQDSGNSTGGDTSGGQTGTTATSSGGASAASPGAGGAQPTGVVIPASGPATTAGGAGQVLGGLAMIGVISKSKVEGIHSFNDKSHYNQWLFAYDPSQDTSVPGLIPKGPYNPKQNLTAVGGTSTGTPTTPGATGATAPSTMTPGTLGSGTASPATAPAATNP